MFDFFAHHEVIEGDYDLKDIQVEEELGRGNSHVYVAKVRGMTMALKQMEIKTDAEYDSFLKEITFMQKVSQWSQWIVKYEGYLVTKMQRNLYERSKYAFLLMECA